MSNGPIAVILISDLLKVSVGRLIYITDLIPSIDRQIATMGNAGSIADNLGGIRAHFVSRGHSCMFADIYFRQPSIWL
jgi:hypothetical protein